MRREPSVTKPLLSMLLVVSVSGSIATVTQAATVTITVNSGTSTGAIKYGGIGWLYGLDENDYIPDAKITALGHPGYSGQKAPFGLQHDCCDVLKVAPQAKRVGMPGVDIYVQDYYAAWPYPNNGIDSYVTNVVRPVIASVVADPNRSFVRYVPFNEPDWIWYAFSGTKFTQFLNDWKTVYNEIKTRDGATARIIGPNWENYNATAMDAFMKFARDNGCLPDIVSWHSLNDDFFTDWYNDYSNYRSVETKYGISAREIFINEYGRGSPANDIPKPGKLIQYLTRYEKSKVYAGLAYWSYGGTLSQLLTHDGPGLGQEVGAYWLYKWYGNMTGNTVDVVLPSVTGSLQAIGTSSAANTIKVLLGGTTDTANVVVKGLTSPSVNYQVYETTYTTVYKPEPGVKTSGNVAVSGGQATITVPLANVDNAYLLNITPGTGTGPTYYTIKSQSSAKCADVFGASVADGGKVYQEACGIGTNQKWQFVANGSYFKLVNQNSGKCLDVPGGHAENGALMDQWTCNGGTNQDWQWLANGSYNKLVSRYSGKCLDVPGATTADAQLIQWTCSGATNQNWTRQ